MGWKAWLLIINFTLFGLFGWGTYQQITNQQATNQVMIEVHQNVKQAHQLTKVTNQQLTPLRQTTSTIENMNNKLTDTEMMLTAMNGSIERVTVSEQKIVDGLDRLNGHTGTVLQQLNTLSSSNQKLVPLATTVASQTSTENDILTKLSQLTNISIQELAELNKKFKWLSYLP